MTAPTADRLADEIELAMGHVLFKALEQARTLEHQLELEAATDGRVAALQWRVRGIRKSIAVLLVDLAVEGSAARLEEVRSPD